MRWFDAAVICGWVFAWCAPAAAQTPEFRAMWATRFEWPHASQDICQAAIDELMSDLADAHFNAVFFQIRGQADVLYPSPVEVWSPLIGGQDPGWDPLAYAIQAAHAHGIQFHAYINTHTCWQSVPAAAHTLPENPNHTFYAHCNAADPAARDWLLHDNLTAPAQFGESHYVWFAPGVPACQAYTRQQVLYVVEHYDVDGVHFDRIRTPGTNTVSWDPISRARFLDPRTNPEGLDFSAWTADQITRSVRDMYAAIMALKPHVQVSAAVYPNPTTAPTAQHQDALGWAAAGAMDLLVPMMYYGGGAGTVWDTWLQYWLAATSGCETYIVPGHSTSQGVSSLVDQINLARLRGAAGNSVFSWSSFSFWTTYREGVYAVAAPVPALPWKANPTTGIIVGHVTAPDGLPVTDAQVHAAGCTHTALSSTDGFYSFVHLPPGTYTLSATHPDYRAVSLPDVVVAAGAVVACPLAFVETTPAGDFNDNGWIDPGDLAPMLYCLGGPGYGFLPGHFCATGDGDADADVDLRDVALFQRYYGVP